MPQDPSQVFINPGADPGLVVGSSSTPYIDNVRYPTENVAPATIVNIVQYSLNTIGADNQVLINKNNLAAGDEELTYDANTNILTAETLSVGRINVALNANLGLPSRVKITGGSSGYVLSTDGTGNLSWISQQVASTTWSSITGKPTFATVATSGNYNDLANIPTGMATTTYVDNLVANVTYANLSDSPVLATVATTGAYNDLSNLPNLSAVALSGNYNDLANKPSIPSISGLATEIYVNNKIANVTYANLTGTPTIPTHTSNLVNDSSYALTSAIPTDIANLADATNLLTSGIALTDLSIGTDNSASGGGSLSYANSTGVFTYTPPDLSSYLTTITNIFNQDLNTSNNVTFNSVITSNIHAVNGSNAVVPSTPGTAGSPLTINAGTGGSAATSLNAGNGGNLTITAGDAGSDIGNPSWGAIGGTLVLKGGNSTQPYVGSNVEIRSGNSASTPGVISLHTGANQWTFGTNGSLTVPGVITKANTIQLTSGGATNSAAVIADGDNGRVTLRTYNGTSTKDWYFNVDGSIGFPNYKILSPINRALSISTVNQWNICTILTSGSGYGSGGSSSAVSGGSGTGMIVGYGYGLSNEVVNVHVTNPGTGYVDGEILIMTAGDGTATFEITEYNATPPADSTLNWEFDTDGNLTLPTNTSNINYANGTSILSGLGAGGSGIALTDISVGADNSASGGGDISYNNTTGVFTYTPPDLSSYVTSITNIFNQSLNTTDNVTFDSVIPTEIQQNATITKSTPNVSVLGATPTVVFSAGSLFTSIKLVIAVEGRLDGDATNVDHTQTCEATIAATYNTAAEPIISVYGIVYTSPTPLATFTVARNTVAGTIEVTAINSQTTNALGVRVHAIQFVSRYD